MTTEKCHSVCLLVHDIIFLSPKNRLWPVVPPKMPIKEKLIISLKGIFFGTSCKITKSGLKINQFDLQVVIVCHCLCPFFKYKNFGLNQKKYVRAIEENLNRETA